VRDGGFVACAAPTTFAARKALAGDFRYGEVADRRAAIQRRALGYLKQHARPQARPRRRAGLGGEGTCRGAHQVEATYQVPMCSTLPWSRAPPWRSGRMAGSRCGPAPAIRQASASNWPDARRRARGGARAGASLRRRLGGKTHRRGGDGGGPAGQAAERPVAVQWTRGKSSCGLFPPAALIEIEAGLDAATPSPPGVHQLQLRAAGIDTPYRIANTRVAVRRIRSAAAAVLVPRAGGYGEQLRAGGVHRRTGRSGGQRPAGVPALSPRQREDEKLLTAAAQRFGWRSGAKSGVRNRIGLACGTEKNSVVAACCEWR